MKPILKAISLAVGSLFKNLFGGKDADVLIQMPDNIAITADEIDHCINVVNEVKKVINNPVLIVVTDLTPTSLDNDIRQKISDALPFVSAGLAGAKNFITGTDQDKDTLMNDVLNKVHFFDDPDKDAFYHSLVARLIMVLSDGKVTWSEAVSVIEIYFKQIFSNKI